jgi:hypothetical protein
MSIAKTKLSRRNFLLAVGAGGAATAAAAISIGSSKAVQTQPAPAGNDKRRGKGYQDTAHVRSYYRTTKV